MTKQKTENIWLSSSNMGEEVDKMALYQTSGGGGTGWHLKFQGGLTLSGGGKFSRGDQTPPCHYARL